MGATRPTTRWKTCPTGKWNACPAGDGYNHIIVKKSGISAQRLHFTRRHLPHFQIGGSWYFITFRSKTGILPAEARTLAAQAIIFANGKKYALSTATVMPDHVHILLNPAEKENGIFYPLGQITKSIKGYSARTINKLSGSSGAVWQRESFDRIVRNEDEWREKYEYIRNNAVKAGLCEKPEDYPWLLDGDDFIKRW